MFRVRDAKTIQGYSLAERVVQTTLLLAFLANCALVYLILLEQSRLSALRDKLTGLPAPALDALRQDTLLQLASVVIMSVILVFCLGATWWLRRRYLSSQQALRQVKMLAHDILASMDRGVLT